MSRLLPLVRRYGPLLLLAAVVVWAIQSGLIRHLSLNELAARHAALTAYVAAHPVRSYLMLIAAEVAVTALPLPGSGLLTLTSGLLFGPWLGGLAACMAITTGSTIFFMIFRGALGDLLARRSGRRVGVLAERIRRNAFFYLLSLRLMPMAPLPLTNLASAMVRMRLRTFVTATLIGTAPGALVHAGLGSAMGALLDRGQRPVGDFWLQPQVLAPLAGLAVLSLAPLAYAAYRQRHRWAGR